jgi:hypothetical protein
MTCRAHRVNTAIAPSALIGPPLSAPWRQPPGLLPPLARQQTPGRQRSRTRRPARARTQVTCRPLPLACVRRPTSLQRAIRRPRQNHGAEPRCQAWQQRSKGGPCEPEALVWRLLMKWHRYLRAMTQPAACHHLPGWKLRWEEARPAGQAPRGRQQGQQRCASTPPPQRQAQPEHHHQEKR